MQSKLIGDAVVDPEPLEFMRKSGGDWYAYQNHDMCSRGLGHLQFLKCGEGCTFAEPPARMPDTQTEINWRYVLVGKVDREKGAVVEFEKKEEGE